MLIICVITRMVYFLICCVILIGRSFGSLTTMAYLQAYKYGDDLVRKLATMK